MRMLRQQAADKRRKAEYFHAGTRDTILFIARYARSASRQLPPPTKEMRRRAAYSVAR